MNFIDICEKATSDKFDVIFMKYLTDGRIISFFFMIFIIKYIFIFFIKNLKELFKKKMFFY